MSPRLLRPLASGFNPKSIAGLSLWLDAADASTVTISTGVSVWADKSGNGRNASQATGGKQPAYSSTINGKNVVTFQGTDDTMQIGANAAFNATSQTIIVVARQNADANQALWYKGDSNSAVGVIMRYRTGTTFWLYQKNDGLEATIANNANTNSNVNIYSTVIEPANQSGFVNGTPVSTANVATAYDNNSGPWLGSRRDVGEYLQGDIAEVLHWNRALTAAEREKVQQYLGRKWGITVASVPSVANPEAQDWISKTYANGGTVSASTAAAVSAFCDAIDAASIRDRFFRLNLFCGTELNAALVPLYRGPSRTGTQYGNTTDTNNGPFVSGDYAETGASGGLTSNGTSKYLNTGLKADALGQTDRHLSMVGVTTAATTSKYFLGMDNFGGSGNAFWGIMTGSVTASQFMVRAQSAAANSTSFTASGTPHIVLSGNGSAAAYANGASAVTGPAGAFTAPNLDVFVFALNRNATSIDYTAARLTAYSVGASMTAQQVADYYTAISAFQTSLSRA
jgi:hypothetical protein